MEMENDKCIFMLIMATWITPDRWHNNNAKIHQSEGCLFFETWHRSGVRGTTDIGICFFKVQIRSNCSLLH